ncbi:transcription factor MYB10 [Lathyrus oleraceus]|nr:transcription factor MYB10-like [Pisum sativum]
MESSSLQQEKCNHGEDTRNIVLKKGTWSNEEDQLLREYVTKYGVGKWDSVRKKTKLVRDGKSCRLRWLNHLNPILKKCSFNEEEGRKLIHLYNELGPKWSQMISQFPGRTDNELKNFINSKKRSLKNSKKHLIPESINQVDELNNSIGEISNQQNNASQEEEMVLPRMESDHQEDTLHGNYLLDQIYDDKNINNCQQFSTLADDSSMLCNNEESTCFNNHVVQTLDDTFQDLEDIVPSFSSSNIFFDQDLPPYNLDMNYQLPQKMFYDQYLQNPDLSSNMFFDQDLPPIPQYYPYNLNMDYQFPQEMHSDQYLQNPILSYEEAQYKILEPWLLSECVPL